MSTKQPDPVANATRLLRESAKELRETATLAPLHQWTSESDEMDRAAHAEYVAAAEALEAWEMAIGAGGVEPLRKRECLHQISAPEQAQPVAAQSKFIDVDEWAQCSVEHAQMVLAKPSEWAGYEVRYLYAAPQPSAQALAQPVGAAPMFWVRLLRDGLYEGPVHNNSVGGKMMRDEKPGEWHALYLASQPAAQALDARAQAARTEFEAISKFSGCEWSLDWDAAGFYSDAKADTAFTWFHQGFQRSLQQGLDAQPDNQQNFRSTQ